MSQGSFEELREDFDYFDRDQNGKIDFHEFLELMRALDAGLSEEQARIGFESVDKDGSGLIDFAEFCGWWSSR